MPETMASGCWVLAEPVKGTQLCTIWDPVSSQPPRLATERDIEGFTLTVHHLGGFYSTCKEGSVSLDWHDAEEGCRKSSVLLQPSCLLWSKLTLNAYLLHPRPLPSGPLSFSFHHLAAGSCRYFPQLVSLEQKREWEMENEPNHPKGML